MNESMARYFRRSRVILKCEVVTPMFLGNARQEAEWRAAPFKALLRYWWRITQHNRKDFGSLLEAESELFGCAGEKGEVKVGKSLLQLEIRSSSKEVKEWKIHEIGGG